MTVTSSLQYPALAIGRAVVPGTNIGPLGIVPANVAFLMQGMDAYPTVQPDNGDLIITDTDTGVVLWQIQQSQNFPGPFSWRGQIPLFNTVQIFIEATVGFNFLMWGTYVPDFTIDARLPD